LRKYNVIITGCNSGIGFSILQSLCECSDNIWAMIHKKTDVFIEQIEEMMKTHMCQINILEIDLCDLESIKRAIREIYKTRIPIDILINNAAMPGNNTLMLTSENELDKVMKANFTAPSLLMQLVSRCMVREKKGIIINIVSRAGIEDRKGVYAYGASKAALIWGTKAVANELAPYNIRVNAVAPGLVETKMGTFNRTEAQVEEYLLLNDIKRAANPKEIADVVLFLISDKSSYITGQVISVDGGRG